MTDRKIPTITPKSHGNPSQIRLLAVGFIEIVRMAIVAAIPLGVTLLTVRAILSAFASGHTPLGIALIVMYFSSLAMLLAKFGRESA